MILSCFSSSGNGAVSAVLIVFSCEILQQQFSWHGTQIMALGRQERGNLILCKVIVMSFLPNLCHDGRCCSEFVLCSCCGAVWLESLQKSSTFKMKCHFIDNFDSMWYNISTLAGFKVKHCTREEKISLISNLNKIKKNKMGFDLCENTKSKKTGCL